MLPDRPLLLIRARFRAKFLPDRVRFVSTGFLTLFPTAYVGAAIVTAIRHGYHHDSGMRHSYPPVKIEEHVKELLLQEEDALLRLSDPDIAPALRAQLHRLVVRLRNERARMERSLEEAGADHKSMN